jgi:hypothetical protein
MILIEAYAYAKDSQPLSEDYKQEMINLGLVEQDGGAVRCTGKGVTVLNKAISCIPDK